MIIKPFSKVKTERQDGAIYNGYFFSLNHAGVCTVYEMESLKNYKDKEAACFTEFTLDKIDLIAPHSNSVVFGNKFYDEKDEFPLLYTNIYNNYSESENKLVGVCLVYRLQKTEKSFKSTLLQIIEIGFTEDKKLWKSEGEKEDVRPYGNFAVDTENDKFYAFTMRDNTQTTRFFSFEVPKIGDGEMSPEYGAEKVVLKTSDICDYFDCGYQNYMQGACCHNGKIYSLEGFDSTSGIPPILRIIDTREKKEESVVKFEDFGLDKEPEMISFDKDICYFTNHYGNMYRIDF
ncbi:MAG: hypothetical protein J5590_07320 [Clostridia bacterium]|nr:hypothetical protein [Clostridia bacterium]